MRTINIIEELKQTLVERVVERIKHDLSVGDVTALEELIGFIPTENQIYYLDEEDWHLYKKLLNNNQ